jgi:hypothetical protein
MREVYSIAAATLRWIEDIPGHLKVNHSRFFPKGKEQKTGISLDIFASLPLNVSLVVISRKREKLCLNVPSGCSIRESAG